MYSQFVIAALAATAAASTNLFPGHMAIRRDLLVARQTTDTSAAPTGTSGGLSDSECQVSLLSIATELPIPSSDLLEWEQSQSGTDPCDFTSIPSTLSSQYFSYTDAVLSWYSESSSELIEAISACPQFAGAVSEVQVCTELTSTGGELEVTSTPSATGVTQSDSNEPSATGSAATGSSTGTATESGSSDSTGTASGSATSSVETTAGAPLREAGIIGAVLAGVLGVAVAL